MNITYVYMAIKQKLVNILTCERCNHTWTSRKFNVIPETCANCRSPYWNKPRKKKSPIKAPPKPPVRQTPTKRSIPGRGSTFSTAVRRNIPKRSTQKQIDSAGIGGAT
jgi:hypothetical protein